jgi:hypothetical protein
MGAFTDNKALIEWDETNSSFISRGRSHTEESWFKASFVPYSTTFPQWAVRRVRLTAVDNIDTMTKTSLIGAKVFVGTILCGQITGNIDDHAGNQLFNGPSSDVVVYHNM